MISFSWSGEKYLRPASIDTIFFLASFSLTWVALSVATAGASTLATSFFSSCFSDSVFLASSVTAGLAGASSDVTGFATAGAGATSTFGASEFVAGAAGVAFSVEGVVGVVFSVEGAVSTFSSLVGGVTSPVVWTAGWFSVVAGTTPSAATAWAWKAKPINTEAAPIAYLRIEKRCLFSGFIKKPPFLCFDSVFTY